MQTQTQVNAVLADKIFIISEPKPVEAIRETYIARYPNNREALMT